MIKNIKFALLIFLTSITLSSCSLYRDSITVNPNVLKLGMNKAEAQKALRKDPGRIIATRKDPQTNELAQVVSYFDTDGNVYWLYFFDDKLNKWQPASKIAEIWF